MDTQTLVQDLNKLMAAGDEAAVKAFVVEHFKDFPEETQKELAVGLFEDAMAQDIAEREQLLKLKREAVETIEKIETLDAQANSEEN